MLQNIFLKIQFLRRAGGYHRHGAGVQRRVSANVVGCRQVVFPLHGGGPIDPLQEDDSPVVGSGAVPLGILDDSPVSVHTYCTCTHTVPLGEVMTAEHR